MLNQVLIDAPILQSLNWDLPFEIMCNASNNVVGVILVQHILLRRSQLLTRRDREVIDFTWSRVKNNTEFTNLRI